MTVAELYQSFVKRLKSGNHLVEVRDVIWLLSDKTGTPALDISWQKIKINNDLREELEKAFTRLQNGEPLDYVIGYKPFYNIKIIVTPKVLIPRPETEQLVDNIVTDYLPKILKKEIPTPSVLDVCTGSGCIALALAKSLKTQQVTATDINLEAIGIAEQNAKLNNININIVNTDLVKGITDKFDIIVSNPPYLTSAEMQNLPANVRDYEPKIALFGGEDGLDFYKRLANDLPNLLTDKGSVYLEVGDEQAQQVMDIFAEKFNQVYVMADFRRVPRFIVASKLEK